MRIGSSVRLPVRMEKLGFYWTDFENISHFRVFRKSVEKSAISLRYVKNGGHFKWIPVRIYDLEWVMLQQFCREIQNTNFMLRLWANAINVWYSRTGHNDSIIWRMRLAGWINKAIETQIWSDFDRASSLICGNKCQLDATDDIYCRSYCLLNMFRAPLCPSSGAREYYTVGCCLWYLVVCPVCGGCCSPQTGHITLSSTPYRQLENQSTKYHRQRPSV